MGNWETFRTGTYDRVEPAYSELCREIYNFDTNRFKLINLGNFAEFLKGKSNKIKWIFDNQDVYNKWLGDETRDIVTEDNVDKEDIREFRRW